MPRRLIALPTRLLGVFFLGIGLTFVACDKSESPNDDLASTENVDPAEPPPLDSFQPEVVYFAFDSSELSAAAQASLSDLADRLRQSKSSTIQIEGHCDERGTVQYNLALGERRALSVKNYLVNLGVEESRLTTLSYGEEKPVDTGHSESAWSRNRRAEFILSN